MNRQSGQIFVLALIVTSLILISTIVLISGSLLFSQDSNYSTSSIQATNLAEAGIDKAVASLNASGGSYNGENETFIGNGSYVITITSLSPSIYLVKSTGYIPNQTNPKIKKTIQIQISKGTGISFVYGILTGNGGVSMGNGSTINGSIYANGSVTGGNNETITGDVFVAGGTQPNADQQSDCTSCADFKFGTNVGGNNQLDVAQSFKPSSTAVINKVSLKLKKIGSPANPTIRILANNNGSPNKNSILTSGVLSANLVTNQYGFVDVAFGSTPALTANTTYWIMITPQSIDNSNYWSWSEDTLQGYTRGSSAWSSNWQANNPVWTAINGDLGFKTWMGGVATSVSMGNGSTLKGNVHANTINGVTINKDAYYQIISNSTVQGTSYPGSPDPAPIAMPISSANISDWQAGAAQYGITNGNINGCPATLGPGKFVGNFTTNNGCTVTVKTPIWLTGNLNVGNSVIFKMDPSLGASSGQIIVDGTTSFANGDDLQGTGTSGSYLTLLSTYNSGSTTAINSGNSAITGILYAPYGIITLANSATFKEVVAQQISMGNNTTLTYDSGLISTFFSTGPGGSFSVIKGTYQNK